MLRTHSWCVAVVVVGGPITFGDAEHHHLHSKNVNCIQFLHFVCETKGSRCSMLRCSTTYHQLVAGGMEEGLILNLNYNSKSAPGFLLFKAGVSGKDNLNCKESVVADANLPSTVIKSAVKLNPWFVTGFCDAESSFCVKFIQKKKKKIKVWHPMHWVHSKEEV